MRREHVDKLKKTVQRLSSETYQDYMKRLHQEASLSWQSGAKAKITSCVMRVLGESPPLTFCSGWIQCSLLETFSVLLFFVDSLLICGVLALELVICWL